MAEENKAAPEAFANAQVPDNKPADDAPKSEGKPRVESSGVSAQTALGWTLPILLVIAGVVMWRVSPLLAAGVFGVAVVALALAWVGRMATRKKTEKQAVDLASLLSGAKLPAGSSLRRRLRGRGAVEADGDGPSRRLLRRPSRSTHSGGGRSLWGGSGGPAGSRWRSPRGADHPSSRRRTSMPGRSTQDNSSGLGGSTTSAGRRWPWTRTSQDRTSARTAGQKGADPAAARSGVSKMLGGIRRSPTPQAKGPGHSGGGTHRSSGAGGGRSPSWMRSSGHGGSRSGRAASEGGGWAGGTTQPPRKRGVRGQSGWKWWFAKNAPAQPKAGAVPAAPAGTESAGADKSPKAGRRSGRAMDDSGFTSPQVGRRRSLIPRIKRRRKPPASDEQSRAGTPQAAEAPVDEMGFPLAPITDRRAARPAGPTPATPRPAAPSVQEFDDAGFPTVPPAGGTSPARNEGDTPVTTAAGTGYAHLIDPSTPQSRAASYEEVANHARQDGARLSEMAEAMRQEASGLADKEGMEVAVARLLQEANRAAETAEIRAGTARAFEEAAAATLAGAGAAA